MILNEVRVDYIRLTSFDPKPLEQAYKIMSDLHEHEEGTDGQFLQYHGTWCPCGFFGAGIQGDSKHWLIQASGEVSHVIALAWHTMQIHAKCTRLDLQVTVPLPPRFSARYHADLLRTALWPSRKRKVNLIDTSNKLDTIYIGSREAERLVRIYVKEGGGDTPLCLRLEVELKGELANEAWDRLLASCDFPVLPMLRSEFERLPILETDAWLAFEKALPAEGLPLMTTKNVPDSSKTLRWLMRQVDPALRRMLNDHEHGHRVLAWLEDVIVCYRN